MGLQGTGLQDKNVRLRFFIYIFMGVVALGSVLYWRTTLLVVSEYDQIVPAPKAANRTDDTDKIKSKNYQIESFDVSPTVK
jgi:hypothetical protein